MRTMFACRSCTYKCMMRPGIDDSITPLGNIILNNMKLQKEIAQKQSYPGQ